ncbi:hypothetical protein M011DRAFT_473606 [Sporormia fimetaria CBS 119925]|uniref:RING-type domain-containing protein n=1 Tax=Sporormia fimetaria CBS 119925 TaxID=1340428 RepID=A0A6A6VMP6_9PLEO|nr:hypothetical protein M011DRAFT_473606 [Sporormia fimetaria CBS 119925]
MAASADPKAASLADDLKEYALTLPSSAFPKNFFCASCSELAIDAWKLLCCNKAICATCYAKLEFPTSCPLCDHAPLEADSSTPNKSLRNTMRLWLQKQKKKEEAKGTPQLATPTEPNAVPADAAPSAEPVEKPAEGAEDTEKAAGEPESQDSTGAPHENADAPPASAPSEAVQGSVPPTDETATHKDGETQKPDDASEQPAAPADNNGAAGGVEGQPEGMFGNNAMYAGANGMGGMPGQFGFGFPNQGNFNAMGFNGMNGMMGNAGWGNMNQMDYNMNMSNMYGFDGNMGMPGMNDMSAMNMMQFGGGFGNGWQGGMNGGYENFNGFNPMGGFNQSGPQYPQMMNQNQFKNNVPPNQSRFPANGAANFSQQQDVRRGSQSNLGGSGSGLPKARSQSRPGSQSGPPQQHVRRLPKERSVLPARPTPSHISKTDLSPLTQRDGETPADGDAAEKGDKKDEASEAPGDAAHEGKADDGSKPDATTGPAEGEGTESKEQATNDGTQEAPQTTTLNPIQTVDTVDDGSTFQQQMMNNAMPMSPYGPGMMGGFPGAGPNMQMPYGGNHMGFNHPSHHSNFGSGGYNGGAYGAATVLTGEPRGLGVEGAPTGPRAMREGRPNTGFSSRMNNMRYGHAAARGGSVTSTSAQETVGASPARRGRSSPERDEALRTKDKSPSRTRSSSRARKERGAEDKDSARSPEPESSRRRDRTTLTPESQADERRREHRHERSSRRDDYDNRREARDKYAEHHADDRDDRARSTSLESTRNRSWRHEKEKEKRSSRSHRERERSREYRRRHRSRSPADEDVYEDEYNGADSSSSRRKHRSEKEKEKERHRDRDRERDREREREKDRSRRDRDREYEREKEKERSRDKEKEREREREGVSDRKRSRRDRDDDEERDYVEEKYRSSRRSRRERDGEREEEEGRGTAAGAGAMSPPLNAPTGPSAASEKSGGKAEGFSIKGFSKARSSKADVKTMPPPPTAPRGFQPPKGPAASRERKRGGDREGKEERERERERKKSVRESEDHYAAEREKHIRERMNKDSSVRSRERDRDRDRDREHRYSASSKRPREDEDEHDYHFSHHASRQESSSRRPSTSTASVNPASSAAKEGNNVKPPTGPAAHRDKRRKSSDNAIANLFTAGLRKQSRASVGRRGGVKIEGEGVERDLERSERERERERW